MSTSNSKKNLTNSKQSLWQSFRMAFSGIGRAVTSERNFQIHLVVTVLVVGVLVWLSATVVEWAIIVIAIVMVLSFELVNTALEKLIDFLNPQVHPTIKTIKDMVGGAVLMGALGAVLIGLIIILPKILILYN
jgi:undecaprenol kinase